MHGTVKGRIKVARRNRKERKVAFIKGFVAEQRERLYRLVARFMCDMKGVSTVEYALLVVGIIGIVGVGVAALTGAFTGMFQTLSTKLTAAVT